ncbi:hypothetical protein [Fusobacterium sp.]|uniref:hypothetical protein n=1 Tax=Fusobacterium sp. TaxID=68766 RepID=UPI002604F103|nr:hypothetical protein [Fusobacterium sp.]
MKKFFLINIALIILGFIFLIATNYYIDSYGVFFRKLEYQTLEPNQNYIKTRYIISNPDKFDTFLFGSSRVGSIPVEIIKKDRIYNMTYSEGIPEEWLETISIFIEKNVKVKKILIGIDDISFKVNGQNHSKEQMRMSYNFLEKNNLKIKEYLLVNPFTKYNKEKLKNLLKNKKTNNKNNFYLNGRFFKEDLERKDLEIETDLFKHLNKKEFTKEGDYKNRKFLEKKKIYDIFKEIERICIENNVEIIYFFNPVHKNALSFEEKKEYEKIRNEFKEIFSKNIIYDFADTEISYNNYYWYETSHYRSNVGHRILKRIYLENSKERR